MSRKSEHGSILVMILIAVILFGALSYTVANMMRGGSADKIGEEKASLQADEVLAYTQQIRGAVQDMRISNGCEDTDISFDNVIVAGYTNGTNTDCQVFHANGGGLAWLKPAEGVNDGSEYSFDSRIVTNVGIGTSEPELLLELRHINLTLCRAINKKLYGYEGDPYSVPGDISAFGTNKFTGTYGTSTWINAPGMDGYMAGCFEDRSTDNYFFYQVLLAR